MRSLQSGRRKGADAGTRSGIRIIALLRSALGKICCVRYPGLPPWARSCFVLRCAPDWMVVVLEPLRCDWHYQFNKRTKNDKERRVVSFVTQGSRARLEVVPSSAALRTGRAAAQRPWEKSFDRLTQGLRLGLEVASSFAALRTGWWSSSNFSGAIRIVNSTQRAQNVRERRVAWSFAAAC